MQLINEEVRETGLTISEETLSMAKVLLPEGEQVYQVLDQLDTKMKLQMLLNQFHGVLFWLSVEEFALLCILILFFLRAPSEMWYFLLNAPHVCRGFLGFQIEKRVPASHQLIESMRPRSDEEAGLQMTFVQYEIRMQTEILNIVKHEYSRVQHKLRAYFILTLVCAVCDAIGFLIQLIRFAGKDGDERADVLLIVACYFLLIVDFYYVCWVKNVTQQLPEKY